MVVSIQIKHHQRAHYFQKFIGKNPKSRKDLESDLIDIELNKKIYSNFESKIHALKDYKINAIKHKFIFSPDNLIKYINYQKDPLNIEANQYALSTKNSFDFIDQILSEVKSIFGMHAILYDCYLSSAVFDAFANTISEKVYSTANLFLVFNFSTKKSSKLTLKSLRLGEKIGESLGPNEGCFYDALGTHRTISKDSPCVIFSLKLLDQNSIDVISCSNLSKQLLIENLSLESSGTSPKPFFFSKSSTRPTTSLPSNDQINSTISSAPNCLINCRDISVGLYLDYLVDCIFPNDLNLEIKNKFLNLIRSANYNYGCVPGQEYMFIQQLLQYNDDKIKLSESELKLFIDSIKIYSQSFRKDLNRYQLPKERIYWPDPTHSKYPSSLSDCDLAARSNPIFDRKTKIGSAGSCFAFEIAEVLQSEGFAYPYYEDENKHSKSIVKIPHQQELRERKGNQFHLFNADYGVIYNSLSLYQLAEKAFLSTKHEKICLKIKEDLYIDPFREKILFKSFENYLVEYEMHAQALAKCFSDIEVFLFTMGLNECWRMRTTGRAISRNPRGGTAMNALIKHDILTVQDNIFAIENFYKLIKAYNKDFKLILTVSPIPFLATGRGDTQHVVEANHHSKSVLNVAARELEKNNPDIFYLPSYEQTMYVMPNPWTPDGRHVTRETVEKNIQLFMKMFGS